MLNKVLDRGTAAEIADFFQTEPNVQHYFYAVQSLKLPRYALDAEYEIIRNEFNIPLHDRKARGNQIYFAADELRVNLGVNIWKHAWPRLKIFRNGE